MAKKAKKKSSKKPEAEVVESPAPGPTIGKAPVVKGSTAYWCGSLPDSPQHNITLGGVTFQRTTQKVYDLPGSFKTKRSDQAGQVIPLTPDQVEAVMEAATRKVVRQQGARSLVLNSKNAAYKEMTGDHPLGCYVYMVNLDKAAEKHGAEWYNSKPEPLIARA